MRGEAFVTAIQKGDEEVLKFVVCLRARLLLNSRSVAHFCQWWRVQGS